MVLPHFDLVGKTNDTEAIVGPEVMQNGEEGILGLENTDAKPVTCMALVHVFPGLETAHKEPSQGSEWSLPCKGLLAK